MEEKKAKRLANKSMVEIKWNHKNYSLKEDRAIGKNKR